MINDLLTAGKVELAKVVSGLNNKFPIPNLEEVFKILTHEEREKVVFI